MSKKQRRRRALYRLFKRLFVFLCLFVCALICFKLLKKEPHLAADYEAKTYNTSYHKEELYAANLCIVNAEDDTCLDTMSDSYSYALLDYTNTDALYNYQLHKKIYPASTTKILTALIALEKCDLSETVAVSSNACSTSFAWDEQTCGIKEDDILTLEDLLYGLLLYSGNDTAVAIAEHVGGSIEGFADMMNEKAAALMATNSHFTNPSGLYDDDHYTTAYDLYLIFNECLKHDEFIQIIESDSYTAKVTSKNSGETRTLKWEPTNYYALGKADSPKDVTVIGGKTGTLKAAGNCLILMSENASGQPFISIVMGAESKDLLYKDMTLLLNEIP